MQSLSFSLSKNASFFTLFLLFFFFFNVVFVSLLREKWFDRSSMQLEISIRHFHLTAKEYTKLQTSYLYGFHKLIICHYLSSNPLQVCICKNRVLSKETFLDLTCCQNPTFSLEYTFICTPSPQSSFVFTPIPKEKIYISRLRNQQFKEIIGQKLNKQ